MQTTDAATLLQILQAPAGAALLPMLNDRERMVMDQSNANLQDTLSRTGINQDENRRANERQPLTLAQLQAQTEGQTLQNQGTRFDQGVKTGLGQDFYVDQAKQGAAKSDAAILAEGAKNAPAIAAAVRAAGPAAKTTAMEMLKRFKFPQALIDQVEQEQDPQQVIKNMDAFAESIAKMSRQYIQQDAQLGSKERIATARNLTDVQIANIRAKAQQDVAAFKAKLKSSGGTKPVKESMENLYTDLRRKEMSAGTDEEKEYYAAAAAEVAKDMQNKPAAAGANVPSIVTGPDGRPTIGQVPRVTGRPVAPMPPRPSGLPATQNPTAPTNANAARLPQNQPARRVMSAEEYLNQNK